MKNSLFLQVLKSHFQLSDNAEKQLGFRIKKLAAPRGSVLQWPHETCKKIYFIESGFMRTFSIEEGAETTIDFASRGHFSTIADSFFSQLKTPYGLACETDCLLYAISYHDLMALCDDMLEFVLLSNQILCYYLLRTNQQYQYFRKANVLGRFEYLCQQHPYINTQVRHKHLASYLNIVPQSFTRLLKKYLTQG